MGIMSTNVEKYPKPPKKPAPLVRAKSTNSGPNKLQTLTLKNPTQTPPRSKRRNHNETALVDGMRNLRIKSNSPSLKRSPSNYSSRKKNIEDMAEMIKNKQVRNIVVMAGAGISTASGIPDFRTPGTGLYDNLKAYKIPYPQAVFDMDYFRLNPRPFFTLAKEIYPSGRYQPNYAHYFLRLLHEKKMLLRVYTQNIDGLERLAGLPSEKVIEAHGTFTSTSCISCKQPQEAGHVKEAIFMNKIPRCTRSGCMSLVKPDIVFFGEDLPRKFYYYLRDFPMADMIIVMGTSLEVEPFAGIVDSCRIYVPRVLFNREAVGPFKVRPRMSDVTVKGDIVDMLRGFVSLLGWKSDMEMLLKEAGINHLDFAQPPVDLTKQALSSSSSTSTTPSNDSDQSDSRSASSVSIATSIATPPLRKNTSTTSLRGRFRVTTTLQNNRTFTGIPGQGVPLRQTARSATPSYRTQRQWNNGQVSAGTSNRHHNGPIGAVNGNTRQTQWSNGIVGAVTGNMHHKQSNSAVTGNMRMGKLPHLYKHGSKTNSFTRPRMFHSKTNREASSSEEEESSENDDSSDSES